MTFKLPIDALFPQIGSHGHQVDTGEGDIGVTATGEEIMTKVGPKTRTARQLQDSFGGILGQGWRAERATENAHEHEGTQGLTMDLGQVAW